MEQADVAERPSRGRVVMLVDNDVRGDSRVQKAARSAAEAGWEVILLGERRDAPLETWKIGDAEVRLVSLGDQLALPWASITRRPLRRPLAYPPGKIGGYRLQLARARQADVRFRLAELRSRRREGGASWQEKVGRLRLLPPRVMAKGQLLWARFRMAEAKRLRVAQRDGKALLNTVPVTFWTKLLGRRSWRRLDPSLWQWELAFGPVIDRLEPDIIHAHDFRMIGVGARAVVRARARGQRIKLLWDAHEYLPGLRPQAKPPRWLPALCAYEKEYGRHADAVVTVSPALAELLRVEHGLPESPAVVMNAPVSAPPEEEHGEEIPNLRARCGIGPDTPLLAYSGGINPVRGVDLMIEALSDLPELHLALVSLHPNGKNARGEQALLQAEALGVADRVHLMPYVPHWQVSRFLSTADLAASPLIHLPNHEIALSNKFFEYSHARLPLVVSDVKTMSEMVRSTGQGEVFRAGDVADFVRAVRSVLADPQRYRAAYDRPGVLAQWTWEAQAEVLDGVYSRLVPGSTGAVTAAGRQRSPVEPLQTVGSVG